MAGDFIITKNTSPETPSQADRVNLYIDNSDDKLKKKDSADTVETIATEDYVDTEITTVESLINKTFTLEEDMTAGDIVYRAFGGIRKFKGHTYGEETLTDNEGVVSCFINTDKIVSVYKYNDSLYAVIGTISNDEITYGTPVSVGYTSAGLSFDVCKVSDDKFFIVTRFSTNSNTYGIVATVSGTTPTFGAGVLVTSLGNGAIACEYDSDDKVVFTYNQSSTQYVRVATITGTAIVYGSAVSTGWGYLGYVYIRKYTTNGYHLVGRDTNNSAGKIGYITVSGTSVSVNDVSTISNCTNITMGIIDGTQRSFIMYTDSGGTSVRILDGTSLGTAYGLTEAFSGIPAKFSNAGSNKDFVGVLGANDELAIFYVDDSNAVTELERISLDINISNMGLQNQLIYYEDRKCIFSAVISSNTVGFITDGIRSIVGILAESGSSAETKKVFTKGDLATGLSGGISAGQISYIDNTDGSITLIPTDYPLGTGNGLTELLLDRLNNTINT